ncbi:MAG: GTPase Era [Candidatus Omnitrophica bacterium]|nr:GTPase Era [Candidatus Omnitrophota bacterium]MBU4148759.1 GTPase Era [Candidatus Omnitrophota bacterium]
MFKSGKVAIIGRPNVGKSTLLNVLIKEKLCIISRKPETTRDNIQGVISGEDFQVVFIDTPGMHKPKTLLGKSMVIKASSAILEADLTLVLIEAYNGITREDKRIFEQLSPEKTSLLLINKMDRLNKCMVLPIIKEATKFPFKEIIPISAAKKDGTDIVFKKILEYLPEGFPFFPDDQLSDKDERFFVREIIREKTLEFVREEVPHSIAVSVEEMKEKRDKPGKDIYYIRAYIYVERKNQKGIIIGKNGQMLKKIGEASRKDIETLLQKKVFLDLWVKIYENWRRDQFALKTLGY